MARIRALQNRFKLPPPVFVTDRSKAALLIFIFILRVLSVCLSVVGVFLTYYGRVDAFLLGSCLVS